LEYTLEVYLEYTWEDTLEVYLEYTYFENETFLPSILMSVVKFQISGSVLPELSATLETF
jgi:hypothetical protein